MQQEPNGALMCRVWKPISMTTRNSVACSWHEVHWNTATNYCTTIARKRQVNTSTYENVSERISDYKRLLEYFNRKVVKRKHIAIADTMLLSINARAIKQIAADGEQLYKSVNDLVLYATGAAACSTSDLIMVLEAVNNSLDNIERHLNRAYIETWRYVQVRMGYWKEKVYRTKSKAEILDDAFGRWRKAGKLGKE